MQASVLGVVGAGAAALLAVACARHTWDALTASEHSGTADPALGLETLAVSVAAAVSAWLAVLLLLGAASALPGRRATGLRTAAGRLAPDLGPRVAAALVGSVIILTSAGTAQAHSPELPSATRDTVAGPTAAGLQEVPDRPVTQVAADAGAHTLLEDAGAHPAPDPGWRPTHSPNLPAPDATAIELVSRGSAEPDSVVVRSGDTLWDLAARALGPEADAAAIAEEWPRWHEANRQEIGADPDLLLPGTVLVPPTARADLTEVSS